MAAPTRSGPSISPSDGTLFVGVGDGSDGDANSLRAQDLNSPNGKILRINPDGTAPPDNPFYDGTNSWRSRVWLYGVRNPFGFSLQPETEEIYFGDVGWNTWEEVNHGGAGTNFGWPCYEGNGPQPFFQSQFPGAVRPDRPVTPPFYTYDHGSGSAVIGGPFYTGTAYPQQYRDNFFFADYSGNFIKRVVFDAEHRPGLGATVRDRRPEPGRSHPGSRRDDLLPVVHDGRDPTDPIQRTGREGGGHADQRTLAALGLVLERRVEQPGRRVALLPLGLRGRHDLDRRQSVAYLHDVDRRGRSRLGSR